jgi:hypothetical protein
VAPSHSNINNETVKFEASNDNVKEMTDIVERDYDGDDEDSLSDTGLSIEAPPDRHELLRVVTDEKWTQESRNVVDRMLLNNGKGVDEELDVLVNRLRMYVGRLLELKALVRLSRK